MPHCLSMLLTNLSLTFQLVSAYWPLLCFKVDGHACSWLLREWVATVSCCCVSSLLTMSVSAFRKWVTAMPCCASSSLITPILDYSACEWLLGLSDFRLADHVCSWLFSLWVAALPCCISTLLIIADHILPRMWVVAPLSCISCLLRMLIFYSPESEFWPCFSAISSLLTMSALCSPASQSLPSLLHFWPANDACPCLFSWWVVPMHCCISSLLMILVWDLQKVSGSLHCCILYLLRMLCLPPHWSYLSIVYQHVSAFSSFKPANGVHLSFFSLWVLFICSFK